jgi:hypothetical protein
MLNKQRLKLANKVKNRIQSNKPYNNLIRRGEMINKELELKAKLK